MLSRYTAEMDEPRKKQLIILVAFLLPLVFVGVVLVVSIIPSATLSTEYNFIYATCNDGSQPYSYYCRPFLANSFGIEGGRIVEKVVPAELDSNQNNVPDIQENYRTRLFIHDTSANQSREINTAEAQQLVLSDLLTSPDGVAVEWEFVGGNDFFFVFGGRSTYGYYLTRGNARQKLDLISDTDRYYYQDNMLFLGWVLEQ